MTMQSENRGTGLSNNLRAPPQLDVLRPADELVGLRRFLERLDWRRRPFSAIKSMSPRAKLAS